MEPCGSSCSAWCWVLGRRHRGQSWGAAATCSGRAPCPAARVLAREALPTQGGVHGAGVLRNEMGFFAPVHVGCRGASCGFCPGPGSVSLGGSKASAREHSLQSSGWKPETAAGVVCPGSQHHLYKPPADPQGPTTIPKGFRCFLKRFREPCCLSGLEGVGVVGPSLLTKPGRLRRATAQGRSGFLLSGASWAAAP